MDKKRLEELIDQIDYRLDSTLRVLKIEQIELDNFRSYIRTQFDKEIEQCQSKKK